MKIESTYDFTPIFTLTDQIVLFQVEGNDMVAKINFDDRDFIVENVNKLIKFAPYEFIEPSDQERIIVLTNKLYKCLPDEVLFRLFDTFSDKDDDVLHKAYIQGAIGDDVIEKAWKKHPIGTTVTRKDGKKYTKISETGDTDKDWKLAADSKDKPGKPKPKGDSKAGKKVNIDEHAKNTSESALRNAIKDSSDPEVRKAAQHELDRREKEEKPQEEKGTEKLKGGKGDKMTAAQIAEKHKVTVEKIKAQVKIGVRVEMEHTDDPHKALEITMDHLVESPDYYTKLKEIEKKSDKGK